MKPSTLPDFKRSGAVGVTTGAGGPDGNMKAGKDGIDGVGMSMMKKGCRRMCRGRYRNDTKNKNDGE